MKILKWHFSNWWLLLLATVLVISAPFLLLGFIVAGHIGGAVFGPPAIWNRPGRAIRSSDIAGSYHEAERQWQGGSPKIRASLQLSNDGTMTINNLPDSIPGSDGETNCLMSGSGRWGVSGDDDSQVDLTIEKYGASATCKIEGLPYSISGVLLVAGRSKPFKLYWILGDPDSGEGVWLSRD